MSIAIKETVHAQHFELSTRWIQIDNQIHNSTAPITLYPSVIKRNAADNDFRPVFLGRVIRSKDTTYGIDYYELFTVLLQEFSIDIDDQVLASFFDFVTFNMNLDETPKIVLCDTALDQPPPVFDEGDSKMFFQIFLLHPLLLNLTYTRTGVIPVEGERLGKRGILEFVSDVLTMTVGNIHEAPIKANALDLLQTIVTIKQLNDLVVKFYTQEVMGQLHKIIGSADFLGNPVGLFNNVSSGVSDLFYEPIQGFEITRPQDFGIGIAKVFL